MLWLQSRGLLQKPILKAVLWLQSRGRSQKPELKAEHSSARPGGNCIRNFQYWFSYLQLWPGGMRRAIDGIQTWACTQICYVIVLHSHDAGSSTTNSAYCIVGDKMDSLLLFGFGELYFFEYVLFDIYFLRPPLHNVGLLLCYMAGLRPRQ